LQARSRGIGWGLATGIALFAFLCFAASKCCNTASDQWLEYQRIYQETQEKELENAYKAKVVSAFRLNKAI